MSVSPAQKRWNPPPVPATPTETLTPGLVAPKRSAASCMSGPTVLEPSALMDPVRPESGPVGQAHGRRGLRPSARARGERDAASSATGQMRSGQRARVHSSRAWQRIRRAASRTAAARLGRSGERVVKNWLQKRRTGANASAARVYAGPVAIILVRHAEAEDRALGTPDPERTLVAAGRRAARATGKALAALKVEPQCVVTSPYPRAHETAEIIAHELGAPLADDPALLGLELGRPRRADRAPRRRPRAGRPRARLLGARAGHHRRAHLLSESGRRSDRADRGPARRAALVPAPARTRDDRRRRVKWRSAARRRTTEQSRLFDRELSWLEWDARVLELAGDERIPLLERLRFSAIFSSNLDEFCMVRVAELLEAVRDSPQPAAHRGRPAALRGARPRRRRACASWSSARAPLVAELLTRAGAARTSRCCRCPRWRHSERGELAAMFHGTIFPVLTPLAVGPGRPFPYISNLSLSLGVMLRDPETGQRRLARVKVPEVLPRFLRVGSRGDRFVTLEDLIAAHLDSLFPGMEVEEHAAFRVTRDADFEIEEAADDLLSAVERELRRRRFGEVVRVELASAMSAGMRHQLLAHLHADDAYVVCGRRAARPRRPGRAGRARAPRSALPRVAGRDAPAPARRGRQARRHLRRHPRGRHPRQPSLRRASRRRSSA